MTQNCFFHNDAVSPLQLGDAVGGQRKIVLGSDTPLKTKMTLKNHHVQSEIHLQMVDVPCHV